MSYLTDTIWIEIRKAIRSRMPLFTALGFLIMPLAGAFLIFVYKNPELSRQLGLISAKANLLGGSADWPSYLNLIAQSIAIGGFFLFALIISWIFGREFADRTLKDMLAVPVPRASILLAKFIIVAIWSVMLVVEVYIVSLVMGAIIQLPQGSTNVFLQGSVNVIVSVCLLVALVTPFAFFASLGRGYLLPLGMAVLAVLLANLVIVAGWGEYFPWAVPGLYVQGTELAPVSFWIVALTGLAGMLATYLWWMHADQSR